jgi:hypothetical protein
MRIGCVRSVRKGFILLALAGAAAVLLVPAGQRLAYPLRYRALIISSAREAELDPALVAAVIYCESRFDPSAVSPAGAVGLMQVMPATALWLSEQEGWEPPEGRRSPTRGQYRAGLLHAPADDQSVPRHRYRAGGL